MRRNMDHRDPPHRGRRRTDPRTMPRTIQHWLGLLLVVFAGSTVLNGWFASYSTIRSHLAPSTVLYRAIAIEVLLTLVFGAIAHQLFTRYLLAPLRRQADYDDLTELLRPGAFWDRAEAAIAQAAQGREPVAFVFLDLDDFKQINDTYGHAVGDALLHAFGGVLRQHARAEDIVGRLGGEEFGWLMLGTDGEGARLAALRVLDVCRHLPVGEIPGFGFSAGVASDTPTAETAPRAWELARHADFGLYEAKSNGKAQIIIKNPKEPLQA